MLIKINNDIKTAMREKNPQVRDLLRLIMAKANDIAKSDNQRDVEDKDVMTAIHRQIKQNKDVISIAADNGRDTSKDEAEVTILMTYLPKQKSVEEVTEIISNIVSNLPEEKRNQKGRGLVMKELSQYKDVMDMKEASHIAGDLLNG